MRKTVSVYRKFVGRLGVLALLFFGSASAEDGLRVAVASSFAPVMQALANAWKANGESPLNISYGSTAKLLLQIRNGAPYEVFLSADRESVQHLIDLGIADKNSRYIYAVGALVLWQKNTGAGCKSTVDKGFGPLLGEGRIAMANPKYAPYGRAARQVLKAFERTTIEFNGRLVFGENAQHVYQMARAGHVDFAFLATSHIAAHDLKNVDKHKRPFGACLIPIDSSLYLPIRQEAVRITRFEHAKSQNFLDFLRAENSKRIIRRFSFVAPP